MPVDFTQKKSPSLFRPAQAESGINIGIHQPQSLADTVVAVIYLADSNGIKADRLVKLKDKLQITIFAALVQTEGADG